MAEAMVREHVATRIKIEARTRHRLITLSSVREIGEDCQLGRGFLRPRGSSRNVDKLTSGPLDHQKRALAANANQGADKVPPRTGCGGAMITTRDIVLDTIQHWT